MKTYPSTSTMLPAKKGMMTTKCAVSTENETLSAKQWTFLESLLATGEMTASAAAAGVSRRTAHVWVKLPQFDAAYRAERRRLLQTATATLQRYAVGAARTCVTLMADRTIAPAVRLAAARTILDLAFRGAEIEDIGSRLDALEQGQETAR